MWYNDCCGGCAEIVENLEMKLDFFLVDGAKKNFADVIIENKKKGGRALL